MCTLSGLSCNEPKLSQKKNVILKCLANSLCVLLHIQRPMMLCIPHCQLTACIALTFIDSIYLYVHHVCSTGSSDQCLLRVFATCSVPLLNASVSIVATARCHTCATSRCMISFSLHVCRCLSPTSRTHSW